MRNRPPRGLGFVLADDAKSLLSPVRAPNAHRAADIPSSWVMPFCVTSFGCREIGRSGNTSNVSASCSLTKALLIVHPEQTDPRAP
jgi:hypothetical protein